MRVPRRLQRVHRHGERAVGAVLEADRCGQAARHLAVGLRFGGAGADRSPGDELRQVLRHDRVERLGRRGDAVLGEVEQQLARLAQALLDVERVVHVGVVDQPLPADRGARLLEINAHEEQHRALDALGESAQPHRVLARRRRVVDRTRAHDHEYPRVLAVQDPSHGAAAAIDEFFRRRRQWQRLLDLLRRRQDLAREDVDVLKTFFHRGCHIRDWSGLWAGTGALSYTARRRSAAGTTGSRRSRYDVQPAGATGGSSPARCASP